MELCLYHPEYGYYESPDRQIGKDGDFYTSISVGPVFGELLGWQIANWLRTELSPPFQILECGAHDGQLASDILSFLRRHAPNVFQQTRYLILEPSPTRRTRQQARLQSEFDEVDWISSWEAAPSRGIQGVVLSNELLDAFPVDQLSWDAETRRWFEQRVVRTAEGFAFARGEEATDAPPLPGNLLKVLPDGFTFERADAASDWWRKAANSLRKGRLIAIDYGFETQEFLSPSRCDGTLRAYRGHRQSEDILASPGQQDLTSHVNFSELIAAGQSCDLRTERLRSQSAFLTRILQQIETVPDSFPAWTPRRLRQFQTLTHPAHLGEKFRVLVQRRE